MKDSISYIVPAYNCADTLSESVESIFNGNFNDGDEVIIINDASTDTTLDVARALQKKFQHITVVSHHINKGSAAAGRNTGIDHAKNDLLFCLDADNVLAPDTVHKLKRFMLDQKADTASFGELHYFTKSIMETTNIWTFKKGPIGLNDALAGNIWPGPSGNYLFTKQSWRKAGRYTESVGGAYDSWAFGIKQLATGSVMVTTKDTFYYHRHGYESTFIRDKNKAEPSLIALTVLIPYLHLIADEDVEYMMSKEHRLSWFENIGKRPIMIKNKKLGTSGVRMNLEEKKDIVAKIKKWLKNKLNSLIG